MKRSEIQQEARKYAVLATPWRHRGRKATGSDCVGLLTMVLSHFGVPYVDVFNYGRQPNGEMIAHLRKYLPLGDLPLRPGMIVVLRDDIYPCHVGILGTDAGGKLTLIHGSAARRMVVEEPFYPYWHARFRLALEIPGVEED